MRPKQITQKVIDFECSRINAADEAQIQPNSDIERFSDKYSLWNLTETIRSFNLNEDLCDIHWVGYGDACLIQAFVLCLLSGFKINNEVDSKKFAKIKYGLYQICQKYLTISEQKSLVEKLSSTQYTISIAHYLSKNSSLLSLISKMYKKYIQSLYQCLSPIQELKLFALNFSFLSFEILGESSSVVNNFGRKFYIINQKGCIFVVQHNKQKSMLKESLQINQQTFQSLENSHKQHPFQKSTPKFVPRLDNSIMVSSIKTRLKSISEVNIEGFNQKQRYQQEKDTPQHFYFRKTKKKQTKNESKPQLLTKNSPNLSLRNTIEMHIATLQKYDLRAKKNRENIHFRSTFFKRQSKSKSKSRDKSRKQQNYSNIQIGKSRISQLTNRSPSSEARPNLHPKKTMQKNKQGSTFLAPPKINSQYASPTNVGLCNQKKINFTYFSP